MTRSTQRTRTHNARPVARSRKRRVPLVAATGVTVAFALGVLGGTALTESAAHEAVAATRGASARVTEVTELRSNQSAAAQASPRARSQAKGPSDTVGQASSGAANEALSDLGRVFADEQQAAAAIVEQGTAAALAALRGGDAHLFGWIVNALIDTPDRLCDPELVAGLSELAADPNLGEGPRALALELLACSPSTDATATQRLGELASSPALDAGLRGLTVNTLRRLSRERGDLRAPTRAALLASAPRATSDQRAAALGSIHAAGATAGELESLAGHLADPSPAVRQAAAGALGSADVAQRTGVLGTLEQAVASERNPHVASAALSAVLRVGRAEAEPALARLAELEVVRGNPALAAQVADYREQLAAGESDPARVLRAHVARVHSRSAQLAQSE